MANHQLIINRFAVIINLATITHLAPGRKTNYQLIINRFAVIVNSVALNLSPTHHQNRGIYHLERRQPGVRFLESSDNHPTAPGNHSTESTNRPIIDRQYPGIDRSSAEQRVAN